mgnify:CR=1 FL=1|tara:strand:+ start:336 stop:1061 length:726 start_codon:yes stop_codon:yes gene_type:complete
MVNFAFTHFGKDYNIMGKMLTHSIKQIYPQCTVVDVSNEGQTSIDNTDFSENFNFSKSNFMYDDVKCKKYIQEKYGPTIFLDSDMILLKNIDEFININEYDFSATIRQKKNMIKKLNYDSHKDRFPKLINKTLGETMPYNSGVYFSKNIETLKYMLGSFKDMEKEYLEWYGNQIALYQMIKSNIFKVKIYEDKIYNYTPSNINEDFSKKKIFHFKGSKRFLYIPFFKKIFGELVFRKLFRL